MTKLPMTPQKPASTINRRFWFRLHGYFSLPIWLLFCFVCLTGTIAVVSHEITWLVNPAARADNPQELPRQPLAELVAAVQREVPGAETGYVLVLEPWLVTAVGFTAPGQAPAIAYVNPYTAEVQEIATGITFISFMRSLHGWLLAPWQHGWSIGYYLVSAMSIVVLGALVTGLVVYKKFWRGWTRPRIRWHADSRTLLGDLHRHAGVWSLWFLLVIGVTGGWYLAQAVLWHNAIEYETETPPLADHELPRTSGPAPARISLAAALAQAQQALPELTVSALWLPEHNRDYYSVYGRGDAFLFDPYSWRVQVNPWTGAVARVQTPADLNALEVVGHLADPLHYGTFGGLWTKAIWLVSGLLLTGMSISGFLIWGKRTWREAGGQAMRRRRRARRARRRDAVPAAGEEAAS